MSNYSIALDGPSSAGKSTIAKLVAKKLGFIYIDTGALYRTIAFYFLQNNVKLKDTGKVKTFLEKINMNISVSDGEQKILLDSQDVSEKIRNPEVTMAASDFSALKEVRNFLLTFEQDFAKKFSVVMDGRDIGTVVLPDANFKFFLTASFEERAFRRFKDFEKSGVKISYENVLDDIKKRDHNDFNREIAPLKIAEDAILIDSTYMSINDVVYFIVKRVKKEIADLENI